MIAAVILRSHAGGIRRVAHNGVKVDDPIESPRSSNPWFDGHALCLAAWSPSMKALIREKGRAKNREATGIRSSDDLFISRDNFIRRDLRPAQTGIRIRSGCIRLADVIGAFEQNHRLNSGLRQNVASQPGQCILSPARRSRQYAVAADAGTQQ